MATTLPPPGSRRLKLWNAITRLNVALYRKTNGRVGGRWKRRNPILLLEHVGRHSGQRRVAPLVYTPDGDDLIVVASRGGSDSNPGWYYNVLADPETWIQIGVERRAVVAHEADSLERDRLWPRIVEANPDYASYQEQTSRTIPVIALRPKPAA